MSRGNLAQAEAAAPSVEVCVDRRLLVSETAAFMTDWASFLDDVSYQDPEVAVARGHGSVPLPVGLPSAAGFGDVAAVAAGPAVRRVWTSAGSLEAGTPVLANVSAGEVGIDADFRAAGFSARETLTSASVAGLSSAGVSQTERPVFRTSAAVSRTRVRAFSWGLNDLLGTDDRARFAHWGDEPDAVHLLVSALLIPTVLAAHVLGFEADSGSSPARIETLARLNPAPAADRYEVYGYDSGALVSAGGVVVATVRIATTS